METKKVFKVLGISLIFLLILFGARAYNYYATNILTNEAQSKEEAISNLKDQGINTGKEVIVSDFTGNYVADTAYVISDGEKTYYGQGYYITYDKTGNIIFCLELDETAYIRIADESKHIYYSMTKEQQNYINNVIITTKSLYEKSKDEVYLVAGQVMLWTIQMDLEAVTDNVANAMAEIEENLTSYSNEQIATSLYKTIGQDLIDATINETGNLEVNKYANTNSVNPGEEIKYTISVKNTSNVVIEEVVIKDSIYDQNLDTSTLNSIEVTNGDVKVSGDTIIWTIDEMGPQSEESLTFNIRVKEEVELDSDKVNNGVIACGIDVDCTDDEIEIDLNIDSQVQITKIADVTEVEAGQNIHYTIEVENVGNIGIFNLAVTDNITDENLDRDTIENIQVSDNQGNILTIGEGLDQYQEDFGNNQIILNFLPKNEKAYIEFDIKVVEMPNYNSENVNNIATVCFENKDSEDCDDDNIQVDLLKPGLEITKTADKETVEPGEMITYTIVVENTGEIDLKDLVVTDEITDANLDIETIANITTTTGTAINTDGTIQWTIPLLEVGKSAELTFEIQVKEGIPLDSAEISNTVEVCNPIICDDAGIDIGLTLNPGLEINKTADVSEVIYGDNIHYTLEVKNIGNVGLFNVRVKDEITDINLDPTTIENVQVSDSEGTVLIAGGGLNQYQEDFANSQVILNYLGKGKTDYIEFDIKTVDTPDYSSSTINNIADACFTNALEEEICDDGNVVIDLLEPGLEITKTADKETIEPGETITYTIVVENTGEIDLKDLVVIDEITDANLDIETIANISTTTGTAINTDGTIQWTIPLLEVGASAELTFEIQVKEGIPLDSTEISNTVEACNSIICDDAGIDVGLTLNPGLEINKTADVSEVIYGENIHYTLEVKNIGNVGLFNVRVKDEITDINLDSTTIENVQVSDSEGTVLTIGGGLNQYQEDFANSQVILNYLGKGKTDYIEFDIKTVDTPDYSSSIINNIADACFTNALEEEICDDGNVVIDLLEPGLEITKTADKETIEPGETITYTIVVENTGEFDLENLVVTDEIIDANLDIETIANITTTTGTATNTDGTIQWTIPLLEIGKSAELTFEIQVKEGISLDSTVISNGAQVCSDIICDDDQIDVGLVLKPSIEINKTVDKDGVGAGDRVHYTLEVINTGNVGLFNVKVKDEITDINLDPATIENVQVSDSEGTVLTVGGGLNQYQEDFTNSQVILNYLGKGKTAYVEFDIKTVGMPDYSVTVIDNAADACFTNVLEEEICDNDHVEIPLANIQIIKSSTVVPKDPREKVTNVITPGDKVTYSLDVTNKGSVDLTNVVVTDDITSIVHNYVESTIEVKDGTYDNLTKIVTWNIPTLAIGETKTVSFSAVATSSALDEEILNTACANTTDPTTSDCDEITNPTDYYKNIKIEKNTASSTVLPGGDIEYTIIVFNMSEGDVSDLIITDPFDDIEFADAKMKDLVVESSLKGTLTEGIDYTLDPAVKSITLLDDFLYTDVLTMTFTVSDTEETFEKGDLIENTATACIESSICDDDSAVVEVQDIELIIDKMVDKKIAEIGNQSLTYTLSITNNSEIDVVDVYLRDNVKKEFWDGETTTINSSDSLFSEGTDVGHGNLDGDTIKVDSISSSDGIDPTYNITEGTDYYEVYLPTIPAGVTYEITYSIDQVPWADGPSFANTELLSNKDRLDDYLILNTVTGYYDYDKSGSIDYELGGSDYIGTKTAMTRLATVYIKSSFSWVNNPPFKTGTVYMDVYNIGAVPILSDGMVCNDENDGNGTNCSEDAPLILKPGEYKQYIVGVDALDDDTTLVALYEMKGLKYGLITDGVNIPFYNYDPTNAGAQNMDYILRYVETKTDFDGNLFDDVISDYEKYILYLYSSNIYHDVTISYM